MNVLLPDRFLMLCACAICDVIKSRGRSGVIHISAPAAAVELQEYRRFAGTVSEMSRLPYVAIVCSMLTLLGTGK